MKLMISLMTVLTLSSAFAADLKIIKVKELGPMKNKVIFQSSDVKAVKNSNVVRGKIVAQWGLHVFEVATGFYTCNTNNVCRLSDYERVATFESCIVKNKKVSCSKKISGDNSVSDSRDVIVHGNPDEVTDQYGQRDSGESEFPVRIQDEFAGIF